MSDETGIPAGDSPEDAGSINWEQRYKDTQAEYTRQQQRLKELETTIEDEDALWNLASEKFGWNSADDEDATVDDTESYELEDDESPGLDPAEILALKQEIAALKQGIEPIQSDFGQRAWERDLQKFAGDRYEEIDQRSRDFIEGRFSVLGGDERALRKAVEQWNEYFPPEPKPEPKAPHVPGRGKAVTGGKAWSEMNDQERLAAQMEKLNALQSQS